MSCLGLGLRLGSGGGGCSSSHRSRCRALGAGHLGAVRWRDVGSEAVAMPGGAFRSAARHAGLRGGEQRVSQRHWGTYYPCGILGSEAPAQPLTGAIWLCGYAAVVRWTLLGPLRSADPRCCTSGGFTGSPRCCAPVAPPYKRFGGIGGQPAQKQCPVPRQWRVCLAASQPQRQCGTRPVAQAPLLYIVAGLGAVRMCC